MMPAIKAIGKEEMEAVLSGIKEHKQRKFIEQHSRGSTQIFHYYGGQLIKLKLKLMMV